MDVEDNCKDRSQLRKNDNMNWNDFKFDILQTVQDGFIMSFTQWLILCKKGINYLMKIKLSVIQV